MSRRRAPPIPTLTDDIAPFHYEWVKIPVWRTVYQTRPKGGKKSRKTKHGKFHKKARPQTVTIFSLRRPTRQVILKTPSGKKVFHAIACRREERGFIEKTRNIIPRTVHNPQGNSQLMAKTKAKDSTSKSEKAKRKSKKDEEIEGTEDDESIDEELAELEALATSDEDDEDVDPDTDEEDDEPKKGAKKKRRQSRAAADGKIGTQEIADRAGVDGRTLRMVLRKHRIEKDEESGRYQWDDWDDKEVKKILKLIKDGAAREVKRESLDKLKANQEAKKGKKGKKGKKNKKKSEDEDDE